MLRRPHTAASLHRPLRRWILICAAAVSCFHDPAIAETAVPGDANRSPLCWESSGAPLWEASRQVPLAGRITAKTSQPCAVTVTVREGSSSRDVRSANAEQRVHSIPVLGLKPGRRYELTVTAQNAVDKLTSEPIAVTTAALPPDFPNFSLVTADPQRMEPGVTVCAVLRWEDNAASLDVSWLTAFDAAGEVVWYYRIPEPGGAIRHVPQSGFSFLHGAQPTGLREIDWLGEPIRQFRATRLGVPAKDGEIGVDVDTFHHDIDLLPNGNRLVLSTEVRAIENYPASVTNLKLTSKANVVGDVILELTDTGDIAGRWPLLEILDATRISHDSHDSFWDLRAYPFYFGGTRDWSHCNSVAYDEVDDALIVCLRHQDAVVKIDRRTSEIRWILGDPNGWKKEFAGKVLKPQGELQWPFHAHGVNFNPRDGRLLLFDNGNHRAIPPRRPMPADASYSRAVEYVIDEDRKTVRETWSYGDRKRNRFYSAFVGDADWLPATGNVLITDGGRLEDRNGVPVGRPPGAAQWGRILEVTRDPQADVVFELQVSERGRGNRFGSSIYRAERIPSLSP
jgi:arylsulfate sulfotransferase